MHVTGIRAVVFDVFGTLVDWRGGVTREAAPFLRRFARSDVDAAAFANAWRRRYSPSIAGKPPSERTFDIGAMAHVFEGAGPGPGAQTSDGCSVELYRDLPHLGELDDILDELRHGSQALDFGGGTGRLTRRLPAQGMSVTGVPCGRRPA